MKRFRAFLKLITSLDKSLTLCGKLLNILTPEKFTPFWMLVNLLAGKCEKLALY
jgi:hypothetical protein